MVSSSRPNTIKESLARLHHLLYPSSEKTEMVIDDNGATTTTREEMPPTIQQEIWYVGCAMDILSELQCGQPLVAKNKMGQVLVKVDATNAAMKDTIDTGFVTIQVRVSRLSRETRPLKFQILPRHCVNVLLCLVAGVCRKCHECEKAHRYLVEGLGIVRGLVDIPDKVDALVGLQALKWMQEIKLYLLRHAAECSILLGHYEDATKHLMALTHELASRPSPPLSQRAALNLSWGMLHTATGNSEKASMHLAAAMQLSSDDPTLENDVGTLAKAALTLLWASDNQEKQDLADGFRQDLAARATTSDASPYEKMISSLVQSIHYTNPHHVGFQKAKAFLLEAIRQTDAIGMRTFTATALALLGQLFVSTEPEQAEKMIARSFKLYQKNGKTMNETTSTCALTLSDLHSARGDTEQSQKYKKEYEKHLKATAESIELAQQLME
ncbi:hypothetical protein SmJEL517_g05973 [Synchytrium microbalum]|uniref:MalT-like TPR region domain-containing protein n=1 Tax=Synchytrium microbalum TaxID=1806994 RepID=A0A507BYW7_9FUNG|nr:uncharacterized protein SmJEL517_g05973 [Synchytrium microbalum]TPX30463.1 hypothetical protein SmJEL517_g05973 [Synchytrium microbalum]